VDSKRIPLEVRRNIFSGFQYSLFFNSSTDCPVHNSRWNEEYTIRNLHNDLEVLIAGGPESGIISYIRLYGFYEGGDGNPYRVDPLILFAVLTGHATFVPKPVVEVVMRREKATKLLPLENELSRLVECFSFPPKTNIKLETTQLKLIEGNIL